MPPDLKIPINYHSLRWDYPKNCSLTLVWQIINGHIQLCGLAFDHNGLTQMLQITAAMRPKLEARALLASPLFRTPNQPQNCRP